MRAVICWSVVLVVAGNAFAESVWADDAVCAPAVCGDGVVERGEECDDGNSASLDGCETDCSYSCAPGFPADLRRTIDPATGHCYVAMPALRDHQAATAACSAINAHLAHIDTAAENEFVRSIATASTVWIDGGDAAQEGDWRSARGTPLVATLWDQAQPDDWEGNEDCLTIWPGGRWNDLACTAQAASVCEIEPRASCVAWRSSAAPGTVARFLVDPDGAGGLAARSVLCDMQTDGGGWALVMSTMAGLGPDTTTEAAFVARDSHSRMAVDAVRALALVAHEVRIVDRRDATRTIRSRPDAAPILNLRAGRMLNASIDARGHGQQALNVWHGAEGSPETLRSDCDKVSGAYPSIFWACGNMRGLHLVGEYASWAPASAANDRDAAFEVWIR